MNISSDSYYAHWIDIKVSEMETSINNIREAQDFLDQLKAVIDDLEYWIELNNNKEALRWT